MKQTHTNSDEKQGRSHAKHMWMMAACCGLPIVGFFAIGALGISAPSLETLIALICPLGMVGMMYMMHRDSQNKEKDRSCCQAEEAERDPQDGVVGDGAESAELKPVQIEQPGSFKA